MPLRFAPGPGHVVICDFTTGFMPPEMVKKRPVVVISPRRRRGRIATVVPLSGTAPDPVESWHVPVSAGTYPPARHQMWAKCDLVATVSLDRLDRVKVKSRHGPRDFRVFQATAVDLDAISAALRTYLDFP